MGSIGKHEPEIFKPVGPTSQIDNWANLTEIDLAEFDNGPEARKALADKFGRAMATQGFTAVKGHGFSLEEINRMTNIGWTSDEEKLRCKTTMVENGSYRGFKPRGNMLGVGGTKDQIAQFNWFRSMEGQPLPDTAVAFKEEMRVYSKRMHAELLQKLLVLFALHLELPEDTFTKRTQYEKNDQSWLRITAYYDEFTKEDAAKRGGIWLGGRSRDALMKTYLYNACHIDFNMVSLLWSQPMASLQIQDYTDNGTWKYVPYIPAGLIVNVGHFMEWYSGMYYKGAIHRVVAPPDDQRNHTRCSLFMFVVPNDGEIIETLDSPVIKNGERYTKCGPVESEKFSRARISKVGQTTQDTQVLQKGERAYQIIDGVKIPLFG